MNHDLVRCSDIAKMADVSPTTISTWLKRYDTFPPSVRTYGAVKLYSRQSVETWLNMNRPVKNKPARNKPVVMVNDSPTKPTDADWDAVTALGAAFERIALDRGERLSWSTLFIMAKTATEIIEGRK